MDSVDGDQREAAVVHGGLVDVCSSSSALAATAPRTIGRPQIRVTSPPRSPSAVQAPMTSSFRSTFQSGLSSAVTSVKSAVGREVAGLVVVGADERDVAEELDQDGVRLLGVVGH